MVKTSCIFVGLFAAAVAAAASQFESQGAIGEPPQGTAIESLRAKGAEGLEKMFRVYDVIPATRNQLAADVNRLGAAGVEGNKEPLAAAEKKLAETTRRMERWQTAIDAVGGQRGCWMSRLYWYTDLDEAKAAARRTGRPILSLRLLGKLTDEFSCANSRFFRTALYSNKEISDYLRDNFILHWQSLRPVPRVTIDFGDGRKLERTLTGNSAHYVLSCDGEPLDVLPGLYGPRAFRDWLGRVHELNEKYAAEWLDDRTELLKAYHANARDEILRRWNTDIDEVTKDEPDLTSGSIAAARRRVSLLQDAARAEKVSDERPGLRFAKFVGDSLEKGMDDDLWEAAGKRHGADSKLDEASVAVVRREFPAAVAMRVAISKSIQEDPVLKMVETFQNSMAVDTIRNEYLLHRQVHEQFAGGFLFTSNVEDLNEWVYASLFLTPSSDPWLGLSTGDVYTALDNDGRVEREAGFARW